MVEVRVRILVPSSSKSWVDIDAFDDPPKNYEHRAFHVRFYPKGQVKCYCEGDVEIPSMKIRPDEWQEVFIRADMARASFDLTVGGQTAKDLPFADNSVRRIQSIALCPNTSNGTMVVGRVSVRVIP